MVRTSSGSVRWLGLVALAACGTPDPAGVKDTARDTASADTSDTAATDTSGTDTDGGESASPPAPCPVEMVPVRDGAGTVAWCVDIYENTWNADGTGTSAAGVMPTTPVSIDEAAAACASTPVLGADGQPVGYKRLPTTDEWTDSADGVVGPGGHRYPYGDVYIEGACATLGRGNVQLVDGVQPTGSFPQCVSDWGAYDMVGNIWEWSDSGLRIDLRASLERFALRGTPLDVGDGDVLILTGGNVNQLSLLLIGLSSRSLRVGDDGSIRLDGTAIQPEPSQWVASGYLMPPASNTDEAANFLPVRFVPLDASNLRGEWRATLRVADEGARIPDKRGCAFYTCEGDQATTTAISREHLHDFHGSVGFRCVADPLTR